MRLYLAAVLGLVGCSLRSPVKGRYVYRYPDGTTRPYDLSSFLYQVYVENGNGYDRYPALPVIGHADGTFEIDEVPPDGPFWVRKSIGDYSQMTYHDDHDFTGTEDVLGRPDAVVPTQPTPLEIDATNMSPWNTKDGLWIDCFENATEGAAASALNPGLGSGDTELHSSLDWADRNNMYSFGPSGQPYLMAAGDHVTIARERSITQTSTSGTYALSQIFTASAPAQTDGQPATVSGTFVDVPASNQLAIAVDPASFLATMYRPPFSTQWDVEGWGGPMTAQGQLSGPPLFGVYIDGPKQPFSTVMSYGNPFDSSWKPQLWAELGAMRSFSDGIVFYWVATEQQPLPASSYTFSMPPAPSGPTLDDHPVTGEFRVPAGVALPLDARIPDGATQIEVIVWHLNGGDQAVADVTTDHLPVDLPADLFQPGEHYTFEMIATTVDSGVTRTGAILTDEITLAP